MAEEETIFSSSIKQAGVFSFKELYKFCYDWLSQESGLDISEGKYEEKVSADSKEIKVQWEGSKKVTDYFKFKMKIEFVISSLKQIEIMQDGVKINTNSGSATIKVKGILVRDYNGKFETTAYKKFIRSIYEKWVIPSRIQEFEGRLIGTCDEFLNQVKAWLDLEGRK